MSAAPKIQPIPNLPALASAPTAAPKALLHPKLDFWMMGGASLLIFLGYQLFTGDNTSPSGVAYFMYYLSMLVNWPHFIASYQMLYQDRGRRIFRKPAFFWAGVVVPAVLVGIFALGFQRRDEIVFSVMVQVMFITVGWHYIKQIFGLMIVANARQNFFFTAFERRLILANFGTLWALSFLTGQASEREADFWGVKYDIVGMPTWSFTVAYALFGLTALAMLGTFLKRYLRDGSKPSNLALTALVSLYVWYLPFATHRLFFYTIPFFHSLQYLLCAFALKKGEWSTRFQGLAGPQRRQAWLKAPALYFGASVVLGLVFFLWLPEALDNRMPQWNREAENIWGPTVWMACFQLFLNIHHYFIDNVLWTKDNPEIRDYLLR